MPLESYLMKIIVGPLFNIKFPMLIVNLPWIENRDVNKVYSWYSFTIGIVKCDSDKIINWKLF